MVGIVGRASWCSREPDLIRPGHSRIRSNMAIVIRFIQQKHPTLLAFIILVMLSLELVLHIIHLLVSSVM